MSQRKIEAVLFDLGETLIVFGKLDRNRLIDEAIRSSYDYLKQLNQPAGSYGVYRLMHILGMRWNLLKSWRSGADFDSLDLLRSYGRKKGFNLTQEQWKQLNWKWYEGLSRLGKAPQGTRQALEKLKTMGLKLGVLSNTFINRSSLERHLEQEKLLDLLPIRIYSYELPLRKPDVGAFLYAAKTINVAPEKAIYVGDRLDNDVTGAKKAGMLPVLIRAYTNKTVKLPHDLICIDSIAELPDLITKLNTA